MLTLSAVLFAGGESRRMGSDKATMPCNGQPLWACQLNTLRQLPPQALAVSARAKPAWLPADAVSILDSSAAQGPLAGMIAAMECLPTTHLLALAVDLPRMTAVHLQKLWALARAGMAVIPHNGNYFEPLCAIYPMDALPTALSLAAAQDFSLQSLARILSEQHRAAIYPVTEDEFPLYRNVNTPADLP